jgi:hypothetical protein
MFFTAVPVDVRVCLYRLGSGVVIGANAVILITCKYTLIDCAKKNNLDVNLDIASSLNADGRLEK